MYFYKDINHTGLTIRNIIHRLENGAIQCFPDVETNDGPERKAYLAWVAEGNTATEWEG